MIDSQVKRNRWLLIVGLTELIYGLGEAGDTLYLLFLQARLLPNLYLAWTFPEIKTLMDNHPLALFPVFVFISNGMVVP